MKIEMGIFLYVGLLFIFLLFPHKTFAAAPSTGLVADWDPALITGTNDGDAVSTLPDSVASQNATSTGSARPTYKTSVASYPVLLFDGTDDYLQTNPMSSVGQPYTIFLVFQPLRWKTGDRLIDGRTVNTNVINQYPTDITVGGLFWGVQQYSLYAGSAFTATNPGGALIDNGAKFGLLRAKFNGASSELSLNRNTATVGNPGSSAFSGITIGDAGNLGSFFSKFYLARVLVYNSSLVSASDVEDYLTTTYAITVPNLVLADGDSLTRGIGSSGYPSDLSGNYPSQLLTLLGSSWAMLNTGVSSQTIVNMESDATTEIDPQLNASSTNKVLVAWGGTNDLYNGDSAATVYSNYVTYVQNRRAAGWKVIATTILPRSAGSPPASFNADRLTINANIRANWRTFADGLADVAADNRIGDAGDETNTTYYSGDNVHLKDAGYAIVAAAVKTQIDNATDTTVPTVSVTAPTAAATVSGVSVALTASASDNLSDLVGVQFKLDTNTNIGAEDTTSTYGVTWDSTAVADGSHTIIAVARDGAGNYATSSAITVTVDNTAPVRSGGSPSGSQPAGTTQVTLSLTTDESATCKYSTTASTAYASITSTFTTTGGTSHSDTITGLSNGQSYNYYVRCVDGSSNANTDDYTISFSVASPVSSGGGSSSGSSAPYPTAPAGGFTATRDITNSQNKTVLHFGFGNDITNIAIAENVNFYPATYINATTSVEWTATTTKILYIKYCNRYGRCSNPISLQINAFVPTPIVSNAYLFYKNLSYRMTNSDVKELQKYLNANGFVLAQNGVGSVGKETNYFGLLTKAALIKFQEAHAIDILVPVGLIKGTGYFGPSTRTFVNK